MGRQHQGIDRPGVRQVPEGSGEQRKLEETGGEVICGAPTTVTVTGQVKVRELVLYAQSITKDYIRPENKLQSISYLFILRKSLFFKKNTIHTISI